VWEVRADENAPNEKLLNCTNVVEINILVNIFLNYIRRLSCHGGYREMERDIKKLAGVKSKDCAGVSVKV
jgi:hypothetical protein